MLPLLIYAASKSFKSKKDAQNAKEVRRQQLEDKDRERTQRLSDAEVVRQQNISDANTVFNFGTSINEAGDATSPLRAFNPDTDEAGKNWQDTHRRIGTTGAVTPVASTGQFPPVYMNTAGNVVRELPENVMAAKEFKQVGNYDPTSNKNFFYDKDILDRVFPKDGATPAISKDSVTFKIPVGDVSYGTEVEAAQALNDPNIKKLLEEAGLNPSISRVITTTSTDEKGGTKTSVNITPLTNALRAAKEADVPPVLKIPLKVGPGIKVFADNKTNKKDELDQLAILLRGSDIKSTDNFRSMVPLNQQEAVIRSIASSIAESNTNVSKETGVSTVVLPLQKDTPDFLQANYPTLFAVIPDLSNAVRQSLSLMKTKQIISLTNKNAENGFNTRNAIAPIADEEKVALNTTADKASVVTPEKPIHTKPLNAFAAALESTQGVDPNKTNSFIQNKVYVYTPDLSDVAENQPKADFIKYLMDNKVANTDRTFFSVLQSAFETTTTTYDQAQAKVAGDFVAMYERDGASSAENFDSKVDLIMMMTPTISGNNAASLMYAGTMLKNQSSFVSFQEQKRAEAAAFKIADQHLTGFISTYRNSDGELLAASRVGELYQLKDGALFMIDEYVSPMFKNLLPGAKKLTDKTGLGDKLTSSVFGQNKTFTSFSDLSLDEQRIEAKRRGVSLEQFTAKEKEARAELEAMFQKEVTAKAEGDEETLKYAMRGYYRFMTAYALASATQGGTGGRTISDQDVLNFLKAFNNNKLIANPAIEEAVLINIQKQVRQQIMIAENIAGGGHVATSTLKLLSLPGVNAQLSMAEAAEAAGVDMGSGLSLDDDKDKSPSVDAPYSVDDFNAIVANRTNLGFAKPFDLGLGRDNPNAPTITTVEQLIQSGQTTKEDVNNILGRR